REARVSDEPIGAIAQRRASHRHEAGGRDVPGGWGDGIHDRSVGATTPIAPTVHHRAMTADSVLSGDQRPSAAAARPATLATVGPAGRPRLVPICFSVGGDGPTGKPL